MRWMNHSVYWISTFAATMLLTGCATQKPVVAEIGGDKIRLDEFDAVFAKNNGGVDNASKASAEDRQKFLDLYIKFRLKVKEAYNRGYDKDPEILTELGEYRRNLSVSYLLNKELTEPEVRKMYNRRLEEVRASHILLQIAPAGDTLESYRAAIKIIDSLKTGRSFEELAVNNSKDPSVVRNNGDLYYFTSGAMVPEFEDAVYSLKPGEFSQAPVRTRYGYHIIKVTDRRPNPGSVRVRHIMKRLMAGSTSEDSMRVELQIRAILDSLVRGSSFEALAEANSDDHYSRTAGGDLGFIERRRTVPEFDQVAFSLKKGERSGIVRTMFGLHIIEVTDQKAVPPFREMEQDLRQFYQQYRFDSEYSRLVTSLKQEYGFAVMTQAIEACVRDADTTKHTGDPDWDSSFTTSTRGQVLYTYAGQHVTVDSMLAMAKTNPELRGLSLKNRTTLETMVDKIGRSLVVEYRAGGMEERYPEFAQVMSEYRDGILLFKAEQEEVWNRIIANDSTLRLYYDSNRDKYIWPDRVNVQEIYVLSDSVAKVVEVLHRKQKIDFDTLASQYNRRESTKTKNGEWGMLAATTNPLTERGWGLPVGSTSEFFPYENGFSIIKVLERDPSRHKTFGEAGSELSSAFQEYEAKRLESGWIERLKAKYPVVIHPEMIVRERPIEGAAK